MDLCIGCKYVTDIRKGCSNILVCHDGDKYEPMGFVHEPGETINENRELNGLRKVDMVNHPNHYQTKSGLEAIDVIAAFTENLSGIEAFDTSNILKYACRWKQKNGVEDLKKIVFYANHLIDHLEK